MNKRRFQRGRKVQEWSKPAPDEDQDQRLKRIEKQHPQYRFALKYGETVIEGGHEVNPTLHVQLHLVVENQILDREPPFVAEAAEAMERAGMDPHDVRHYLAEIMAHQVHVALSGQPYDKEQHRERVEELLRNLSLA